MNVAGPSTAPNEHCIPCAMDESIDQQPISGQVANFESGLVQFYGQEIMAHPEVVVVADTDLDAVTPKAHTRHEAALHCAEHIAQGICPLFMFVEVQDSVFKLYPKTAPTRRHLQIAN